MRKRQLLGFYLVGVIGCVNADSAADPLANWQHIRPSGLANGDFPGVAYGNGIFVTAAGSQTVALSRDGAIWNLATMGGVTVASIDSFSFANGVFYVGVNFGAIVTSTDGLNWTWEGWSANTAIHDLTYGHGLYVVVSDRDITGNNLSTSSDGVRWTQTNAGIPQNLLGATFGAGTFVIVGGQGAIASSTNGSNWTVRASKTTQPLNAVVYGGDRFVAVGSAGTILISSNAVNWVRAGSGTSQNLQGVAYGSGYFVAVGVAGTILTSSNGLSWNVYASGTTAILRDVTFGNRTFVAVGDALTILQSDPLPASATLEIAQQPRNQLVMEGGTASFSVVASGTEPISFQWHKDATALTDGGGLSGSASARLEIANAQLSDAGMYHLVISNAAGAVTSQVARLTVRLADPVLVGSWPAFARGPAQSVAIQAGYAYIAIQGGGLAIFDIRNPGAPVRVGGYDTTGYAESVQVVGNYAYVAHTWGGLQVIDVSNPANPIRVGESGFEGYHVHVVGNHAYLASAFGLQIINVSNPASPVRVGGYNIGYAFDVEVVGNYAYVAADDAGLQIINVSDPANPVRVGGYDTSGQALGVDVLGNYAYVADGLAGVRIIDIRNPATPVPTGDFATSGYAEKIQVLGSYAYVADRGGSVQILDVSNPASPVRAGDLPASGPADVQVLGNYAYVADGLAGLQIIDVSNPASPLRVGGDDSSGQTEGVQVVGSFAYIADGAGGLQIIDVSTPSNPTRAGHWDSSGYASGVQVVGNYAYLADGPGGLQIIDVSAPANPVHLGTHPTTEPVAGVHVAGNYAYVAKGGAGVEIVNVSNPATPVRVGSYDTSGFALQVQVVGNYAYVADLDRGVQIIDVSNPAYPVRVSGYATGGYAYAEDVQVVGNYAYLAEEGLLIINVGNPANPVRVAGYQTPGHSLRLHVAGSYAYVADGPSGLQMIDISNPAAPRLVGSYDTDESTKDVAVAGSYAYLADGGALRILSLWSSAPLIVTLPLSRTNLVGTTATFTVGVRGIAPMNFLWHKDGVALVEDSRVTGATSPSVSIANLQFSDAGAYTVVISNAFGVVTSQVAQLSLIAGSPPQIIEQPQGQTNFAGSSTTFAVFASGTEPLGYLWHKEVAALVDDGRISGARSSLLSITNLQLPDTGNYSVVVSNGFGSVTSAVATLIVTARPGTPEIVVEELGSGLTNGSTMVDFGTRAVGGTSQRTLTIRNNGYEDLTGLGITIDGMNGGDFILTTHPTAPLAPGESTWFTVAFFPGALGARTAALHITSNDGDESPFDIGLSGIGSTVLEPPPCHLSPLPAQSDPGVAPVDTQFVRAYGQRPLYFVENQQQTDPVVDYIAKGNGTTLYFTSQGVTLAAVSPDTNAAMSRLVKGRPTLTASEPRLQGQPWSLKLDFVGGRSHIKPVAEELTPAVVSYFKGPREQWKTGLRTYARLVYPEVWPGIAVEFSGTVNRLKYTFLLNPGADPHKIRLGYRGARGSYKNADGKLKLRTPAGVFYDDNPVAFQEIEGRRVPVSIEHALDSPAGSALPDDQTAASYGFQVGAYDRAKRLIIEPAISIYSDDIGGAGDERGLGIEVDAAGSAYVCGWTTSPVSFPEAAGPDLSFNGDLDAFVLKLDPAGTLIYAGYIGGVGKDEAFSIAVDAYGSAYVGGATRFSGGTFPVRVGPGLNHRGGSPLFTTDAFVAKVAPDGRDLVYCGYIGGTGDDTAEGVALDAAGNLYVTGTTSSSEASFPVAVGPDLTFNGGWDTYVAKVKPDGSGLAYCGYIGGPGTDCYLVIQGTNVVGVSAGTIAVDNEGSAYVGSFTDSRQSTFPNGNGFASLGIPGFDQTFNGGVYDAFVAKVKPDGRGLVYASYLGGADFDGATAIAVDSSHNAYVCGHVASSEATFPVKGGPDLHYHGGRPLSEDGDDAVDGFVAKLDPTGGLVYCGYIGGSRDDFCTNIRVDAEESAYVVGGTESSEDTFPVTGGPKLTFYSNNSQWVPDDVNGFAAKLKANPTHTVVTNNFAFLSYVGSSGFATGYDIAVDNAGDAYVCGDLYVPHTRNYDDLFVAKIASGARLAFEPSLGFVPGGFGFSICGTAGLTVSIQRSVNLLDWVDWRSVTLSGRLTEFTDLDPSTNTVRFYRAVAP